ncbi:hypothetical protein QTP70_002937 [Hemibagrus guttatus]|uniref:Podocalyxin n=1 Tax=Hemibagrus guttatus TaxID=175788 RepID=A0AAE0QAU2_9TELE|nr:hypothetical protein QTP70_002937 [Hemibagrus guttatus]
MEITNGTGKCNIVGVMINGVVKYNYITITMDEPSVETSPTVESNMDKNEETNGKTNVEEKGETTEGISEERSDKNSMQHLTEELQTVENGYHDNPTLEVMEVQPEMQEKKMALNGEFNDSWIVPFDNLAIPEEEDTHL